MSSETIKKFIEEYKVNPELQQKLKSMKSVDEAVFNKVAKEAGFDLTAEEWREYADQEREVRTGILTDDELANVSAGGLFGMDLCQKKFDDFLCKWCRCGQLSSKEIIDFRHDGQWDTEYFFCRLGYWDETKNLK